MTTPLQILLVGIKSIDESSSTVLKSKRISVVVVHLIVKAKRKENASVHSFDEGGIRDESKVSSPL